MKPTHARAPNLARAFRWVSAYLTGDLDARQIVLDELDDPDHLRYITDILAVWIAAHLIAHNGPDGAVDFAANQIDYALASE
jgi:hypothetical protein